MTDTLEGRLHPARVWASRTWWSARTRAQAAGGACSGIGEHECEQTTRSPKSPHQATATQTRGPTAQGERCIDPGADGQLSPADRALLPTARNFARRSSLTGWIAEREVAR